MYTDNSGKKSPRVLWEGTVDNATEARVVSVRYPMMDNIAEVVPEELRKNAMGEMVWWRATDAVTAARIMERAILGLEDRVIAAEAGLERLRVIAEGAFKQHVEAQKPPALAKCLICTRERTPTEALSGCDPEGLSMHVWEEPKP